MHDARFMADLIYLLSIELFSKEYPIDTTLANKGNKMATFISCWNAPNFLKWARAVSAPANDLKYFYDNAL